MTNPYTLGEEIVARLRELPALVALTEGADAQKIQLYRDADVSLSRKVLQQSQGTVLVAWLALEPLGTQFGGERYANRFGVYGRGTGSYGDFLEALFGGTIGATGRRIDEYSWTAARSIMFPPVAARQTDETGVEYFEVMFTIPDRT